MPKYYPPKKRSKKEIVFDIYNTDSKTREEIEAMPPDPVPKQRKKRVEREIIEQRKFVVRFAERWPWPSGPMVISIRDERGQYIQGEAQLQAGEKRPDIFIAKQKIITLPDTCTCSEPLLYSTLETHCLRCGKEFGEENVICGLFLEMKTDRNKYLTQKGEFRQSKKIQAQLKTLLKLRQNGYLAFFAGGFDEAMSIAEWYMDGDGCHPLEHLYSDVLDMVDVVEIRPNIKSEVRNGKIIIDPESFDEWLKN